MIIFVTGISANHGGKNRQIQNLECDDTSSLKETTARGRPWDLCVDKVLPQCKTAIGHNKQMYVGGMYEGNLQVTILQFLNIVQKAISHPCSPNLNVYRL